MTNSAWVIFTDLDGTLLDHHNYSFEVAKPAIELLRERQIPWLFNTSKTFAELKTLREELDNPWPFIVENGSGIAIPDSPESESLFSGLPVADSGMQIEGFKFYSLGELRSEFMTLLHPLKKEFSFLGYGDMQPQKLMELTGLSAAQAELSMDRHYTEPCLWLDTDEAFTDFCKELESLGLQCIRGGRFAHIMGKCDKGRALKWCMDNLFAELRATSVALGDGENDLPMLNSADVAILVRSPVHKLPGPCLAARTIITDEIGPAGWSGAIIALCK
jgi:mannosyl-3-phosphoglycerate phosphatase